MREPVQRPRCGERYQIEAPLGDGAVATVWRARDLSSGELVAIKLMHTMGMALEDVQRLAQEVEILHRLSHPCIIKIFDTGVAEGGRPFMAMEYVEGISLRQRLQATPRLPLADLKDIICQVCAGLSEAHAQGVIHRDVKPENVLLCAPEHVAVKLVDFGMAKNRKQGAASLTRDNGIFGTPEYMAPERALGEPVSAAMDVYAVAVMSYEMLGGVRPFDGATALDTLNRHIKARPAPLDGVSPAVERIVWQGLAKEPGARPVVLEFGQLLARALEA